MPTFGKLILIWNRTIFQSRDRQLLNGKYLPCRLSPLYPVREDMHLASATYIRLICVRFNPCFISEHSSLLCILSDLFTFKDTLRYISIVLRDSVTGCRSDHLQYGGNVMTRVSGDLNATHTKKCLGKTNPKNEPDATSSQKSLAVGGVRRKKADSFNV